MRETTGRGGQYISGVMIWDDLQESLLYGLAGLFLAGLLAMGITWLEGSFSWWIVAAASAVGFLLCGYFRERALGWLFELLWWM